MEHTDPTAAQVAEHWPLVLVPEPPPWPRSFGWVAEAGPGSATLVWWPGEPADSQLPLLRELSPRIEVELARPADREEPGGELDVLVGERRLPGVLARARDGWTATLLVSGEYLEDQQDMAVTVRGTGVPVPVELRLQVRPVAPLLQGRERVLARVQQLS